MHEVQLAPVGEEADSIAHSQLLLLHVSCSIQPAVKCCSESSLQPEACCPLQLLSESMLLNSPVPPGSQGCRKGPVVPEPEGSRELIG